MTENQYYNMMCGGFKKSETFEYIHENWYKCFDYVLRKWKCGYNKKSIHSLFYNFDMQNWELMHRDKTGYKDYTKEKLIKTFIAECDYVSDRMSYDRLFRTHWFFLEAFRNEINAIKYPEFYGKKK